MFATNQNQSCKKTINTESYFVDESEFNLMITHQEYNNLKIIDGLGEKERIISVLKEISSIHQNQNQNHKKTALFLNSTHGGFIPLSCFQFYENIDIKINSDNHEKNIGKNIQYFGRTNIKVINENNINDNNNNNNNLNQSHIYDVVFIEDGIKIDDVIRTYHNCLIVYKMKKEDEDMIKNGEYGLSLFYLTNSPYLIHVPLSLIKPFQEKFNFYIETDKDGKQNQLNYDNLVHLCIMVKNAGPQFQQMLEQNMPYIDRWTILDTGSTDETISIIENTLVGKKRGELFQEPFINFKESRNRCLNLAGNACKYTIMLDDTYILRGNLRDFLNMIRGDQYASSFNLFIHSYDMQYASNRILKTNCCLRYIYKIHEVITDKENVCVIIPHQLCYIEDAKFDYMDERTNQRKDLDIQLLMEELEENKMEPRTYYYLGQTYTILKNFELAFYYFMKRGEFINSGFLQERVDALFEAAKIAQFKLNKPWAECLILYENAFKADETRPESLYYIGEYYNQKGDLKKALKYLKKAFEIGFPNHTQYSLRPTLSFYYLPLLLSRLCYLVEDYELGEKASSLYLNYVSTPNFSSLNLPSGPHDEVLSYNKIYKKLLTIPTQIPSLYQLKPNKKQVFCFVTEGGFEPWTGKSLLMTGLGGSETYIIKMAQCIQASTDFEVIVFCPCKYKETFRGVVYKPIEGLAEYLFTHSVQHCLVSRYSEYIPLCLKAWTENVYLMVHDLTCSGIIIPTYPKLKHIFCLTDWHVQYFSEIFPSLKHLITPFNNGTDMRYFDTKDLNKLIDNCTPIQFIYSSFPNRGLLPLLQMWESIQEIYPMSQLHIYSNLENDYVKTVAQEEIKEINCYLNQLQNVNMHGWVKKDELENAWNNADVWLYPCTFQETFCVTALEAAKTKTFAIATNLAGLKQTVGSRGLLISGDPLTKEWQKEALKQLCIYLKNPLKRKQLIEKNYEWASQLSWDNVAQHFLNNYILQNNFEYMNNFTVFELNRSNIYWNILNILNQNQNQNQNKDIISILHIDCHTGSILIDFLKRFPLLNKQGVGINPVSQEIFKKNISREKLEDSIKCLEGGNTLEILTCLLQESPLTKYDFIYLEEEAGGKKENKNHFYLKCWLGWNLLKDSGVFCLFSQQKNIPEIIKYIESTFQNIIFQREDNFLYIQKK